MRLIDSDELDKVKYHPLPYTHITPSDVDAESYMRGWNDAIDAIMIEAPTIEERKTGKWIDYAEDGYVECPFCHSATNCDGNIEELHFCFSCGAKMEEQP